MSKVTKPTRCCPKCKLRDKLPGQSVCRQCLTDYQRARRARIRAAQNPGYDNNAPYGTEVIMKATVNPEPYLSPSDSLLRSMINLRNLELNRISNLGRHGNQPSS
jgi:hypothetical protein